MSRYRFALRPLWIASHLFVALLVAAMLAAGFWQLGRLAEKRDRNETIRARTAEPVVDVADLVDATDDAEVDELEHRRVTASGTYLADDEVLVRSRSLGGAPGSWVLTPLLLADGSAVAVNRGWIPNSGELDAVPASVAAPAGEVEVTGLVQLGETRGSMGSTDPAGGRLTSLARADLGRLDQQVDADLLPVYVRLEEQDPAPAGGSAPEPLGEPDLDEGPHLSYAVQWFIFTTVALVGYPLILRRNARDRSDSELSEG